MYDVIVIGSGPAGSAAAKTLADTGYRVLIVERFKLPRYKSCSGVLIKKSMIEVERYFGEKTPDFVTCSPKDNRGMIFTNDAGEEYRFEQEGVNVWRSSFDNWLVNKAVDSGAELFDGVSAVSSKAREDGVLVTLKRGGETFVEEAKYVIDAEGVTGLFKRSLIGCDKDFVTTFQTYVRGSIELDHHYFYAYLQPELSEYDAWFNVKDGMLVLGVAAIDRNKIPTYYKNFINYMTERHGLIIEEELKKDTWIMPRIKEGCKVEHGVGRVLFAGETAGFLNPMGEGISAAMESGHLAGAAVSKYFSESEKVIKEYESSTNELREYMSRQWKLLSYMSERFKNMR